MTDSTKSKTITAGVAGALVICALVRGCSVEPQQFVFGIEGEASVRQYWFFPVIEVDGDLILGEYQVKTFDASGYQVWEASATHPRNLLNGWRTPNLQEYTKAGIIVFCEDDAKNPLLDSARIFWFTSDLVHNTSDEIHVRIPRFDSLDRIELQQNWY